MSISLSPVPRRRSTFRPSIRPWYNASVGRSFQGNPLHVHRFHPRSRRRHRPPPAALRSAAAAAGMAEAVADAIADGRNSWSRPAPASASALPTSSPPSWPPRPPTKDCSRRRLHAHHQPAGTADPQGHPVSAKRHAAAVHAPSWSRAGRTTSACAGCTRPSSASGALAAEPGADEQLQQIGRWSRQTRGRQPQRPRLSAAAGRLGPRRERQRQLPGPSLSRLRQVLLLQGPQADVRRPAARRQSRPVLQRPRPAPRRAATCCPTTRSSSSTRPTRWKTWPPTTSACRSAAAPSIICSTSSTIRGSGRGLLATSATKTPSRQVEVTRSAAERFFNAILNWTCRTAARSRGGSRRGRGATRCASASRASSPDRSPKS